MNVNRFTEYLIPVLTGLLIIGMIMLSSCKKDQNTFVSYHMGIDASQYLSEKPDG
jgi:hypothetical protein